eukprot:24702-Pelagomonas_calceolata.AAC.3
MHMKANEYHVHDEPTNIVNRTKSASIVVAFQQGHADMASDSASCLSQNSKLLVRELSLNARGLRPA